jgi:ADP-ribose pyrophosphatase YjhB (NUDIX family)
MSKLHCTACGAEHTGVDWPLTCSGCGHVAYRNPTPVAVVLQPVRTGTGTGLLAIRRTIEPRRGSLALPGGYVDFGESWQAGAARELREETQLEVAPERFALFDVLSPPDGKVVLIFALAPPLDEEALADFEGSSETSERVVVPAAQEMAFPLHTQAVAAWFAGGPRAAHVDAVLATRRTIHLYRSDPLPPGALDAALAAAVQAPNHKHTHPWRFTLLGPETRAKLADIAVACKRAKRELSPEQEATVRAKVTSSAEAIVLRQVLCEKEAIREEDYASVSCAAQNIMLSLHARGVGTKWTTGAATKHPDTYALLGLDPEKERICGILWAGYAVAVPSPPKPALADVVSRAP